MKSKKFKFIAVLVILAVLVLAFAIEAVIKNIDKRRFQASQKLAYYTENNDSLKKEHITENESTKNWIIKSYVDEFGDPTTNRYLTNSSLIIGEFSNSATTGSVLRVDFLIDDSASIAIQLYEYGGIHPVKHVIEDGYKVRVKDKNGKVYDLLAANHSDRLSLKDKDASILSNILCHGGKVRFNIVEITGYSPSSYQFEIDDATGFGEKLKDLYALNLKP